MKPNHSRVVVAHVFVFFTLTLTSVPISSLAAQEAPGGYWMSIGLGVGVFGGSIGEAPDDDRFAHAQYARFGGALSRQLRFEIGVETSAAGPSSALNGTVGVLYHIAGVPGFFTRLGAGLALAEVSGGLDPGFGATTGAGIDLWTFDVISITTGVDWLFTVLPSEGRTRVENRFVAYLGISVY